MRPCCAGGPKTLKAKRFFDNNAAYFRKDSHDPLTRALTLLAKKNK